MAVAGGPLLAPIVAGAMLVSNVSWRWTEYARVAAVCQCLCHITDFFCQMTGMMMLAVLTLDILILDESYPNTLLVYKARRLRHETGNWALHAKHEEWDVSVRELATKYLVRPFQIIITPICLCMGMYAAFVYGIVYL